MLTGLTEPDELAELLAGGVGVTLLDVRWSLGGPDGHSEFKKGHIPGARFVDLDEELAGPPGRSGRHPLPPAKAFEEAMRAHGVSSGVPVVVYDAGDSTTAARCWWLLTYFGHPAVSILDGGFRAWQAMAGPTESGDGEPVLREGDFLADPGHLPLLDAASAAATARSGLLLDARAGQRYRGELEPVDAVAGHIPGAVSAPTSENLDESGRFLSAEELRRRFADLGLLRAGARPAVGVYCGSGVTAAHEVFALGLVGIEAGLYVGSWSEWSSDPSRPVATGPEPG